MKRCARYLLTIASLFLVATVRAEPEAIDLKALAKKARPAVMLLVVSDAAGKEIATGTGFLVSSDGKLITNHHVIENAASASAKAENGGLFPIEGVLVDDPKNDLVVLKLKGKDLPFLPLGKDEKVEVGTRIAVIGSPLGLEGTLSEGIVSAVRDLMGEMRLLQITANISPGSSGSPVLSAKGDVVGVATALLPGGQALNFAVPIECATLLLAKAQSHGKLQPLGQLAGSGKDPVRSDPDYIAARAADAAGDHVEMLKRTQALVQRYPDNAEAQHALGVSYGRLKFLDDAVAALRQAIKLKPDYAEAWDDLGAAYYKAGVTDDAIAAFRQAIKLKPDYAHAWHDLGVAYRDAGRSDEARDAFDKAEKLKPESAK